jgi:hypothetical protein
MKIIHPSSFSAIFPRLEQGGIKGGWPMMFGGIMKRGKRKEVKCEGYRQKER